MHFAFLISRLPPAINPPIITYTIPLLFSIKLYLSVMATVMMKLPKYFLIISYFMINFSHTVETVVRYSMELKPPYDPVCPSVGLS